MHELVRVATIDSCSTASARSPENARLSFSAFGCTGETTFYEARSALLQRLAVRVELAGR